MKTPKEFYLVVDREGRFWAGYNSFTTRPWQAKFYSVKAQAEKTAERCKYEGARVVKARLSIEMENTDAEKEN